MPVLDDLETSLMRRALTLAERGRGRVSPNPMVGAVVVRGGRVIGEGWHARLGGPHAEVVALARAGRGARGATLYVTLEPCAHHGHTPPCVDAILEAGIRRCVVAVRDPHEIVNGLGIRRLRQGGVRVELGREAKAARELLGGYWLAHTAGRPRVTLKLATSLDGRIAPGGGFGKRGHTRWLTSAPARIEAHRLRGTSDAIVVGAGTARADNPRLTARGVRAGRQPLRVVCDSRLRLPRTLRLFRPPLARGTVVACSRRADARAVAGLEALGVRVWQLPTVGARVSVRALSRRLVREGVHEVLLEGGAALAGSFLSAGLVDRLALFVAPRVLGARGLAWAPQSSRRAHGRVLSQARLGDDWMTLIEMGA